MSTEQLNVDLLKGFSPLDGLKRDNLAALARKVQLRELSPGQILFKEGDTEKRTFYVASGILELIDQGKVVETIHGARIFGQPHLKLLHQLRHLLIHDLPFKYNTLCSIFL